jgi:hypothetical protein
MYALTATGARMISVFIMSVLGFNVPYINENLIELVLIALLRLFYCY